MWQVKTFFHFYFFLVFLSLSIVSSQRSSTVCENESIELKCASNEVLAIQDAYYGRTKFHNCGKANNQNCYSFGARDVLKKKCEGQTSCNIKAEKDILGNPCEGSIILEAKYKCIPAPPCIEGQFKCNNEKCIDFTDICDGKRDCSQGEDELNCKYKSVYICENESLNIQCESLELIHIIRGDYGRSDPEICKKEEKLNCHSLEANDIIKKRCNHQQSCTIEATKEVFGDPCPGINKYAEVHYTCWSIPLP